MTMEKLHRTLWRVLVMLGLLLPAVGHSTAAPLPQAEMPAIAQDYGAMPLYFIENRGQLDDQVAYYLLGSDKDIYFTPQGVTFALVGSPETVDGRQQTVDGKHSLTLSPSHPVTPSLSRWAVKLDFLDANPDVQPEGLDPLETVISYFKGAPEEWRTGLHTYSRLLYRDLWPGIDLVYYAAYNELKYEFIVHPGADPARVQLAYRGASDVIRMPDGQFEIATPLGSFRDGAPFAYQDIDGQRLPVAMDYQLASVAQTAGSRAMLDGTTFNFSIGEYDPTRPLILDPAVIIYSTFLGGSSIDSGYSITVDSAGSVYVTGHTEAVDFPTTPGAFDTTYNGGDYDAFVVKLMPDGTGLAYATFLGGSSDDRGQGVVVNDIGSAYVTGFTGSSDFPVTPGAFNTTYNGGEHDAFVVKLTPDGTELAYATFLGGSRWDRAYAIAVDGTGSAYVTGGTWSTNFPTTPGAFDTTYNGYVDGFIVKLTPDGTALVYATFLGGTAVTDMEFGEDAGLGIAVDGEGNAYVTGYTGSRDFPTTPGAFATTISGNTLAIDAFVAKLTPDGAGLAYSTFLGGSGWEDGRSIAVDSDGNAYVTGWTASSDFPTTPGAFDTTHNSGEDVFIVKLTPNGTALAYSTFLGGSDTDWGYAIAVDGAENAYLTGFTRSSNFPTTPGAFDTTHNGGEDVFIVKLASNGAELTYATFLGGSNGDRGYAIAVDSTGSVFVTGSTNSSDFPTTNGAFDTTHNGSDDAFVIKIAWIEPPAAPTLNAIANADGDGNYTVSWSSVSHATGYTLQEAANSSFTGAVTAYSGSSTSTNISGKSPGTYYYRVRASNASGDSAWSNTQSVVVVAPPAAPTLNAIANADGDGNYTVSWNSVSTATGYTLQEATNSSFTGAVTAYSGSSTSTNISGKSPGTYYYRVRASNVGGDSAWSNTQSVVVVAPPAAPTLNAIANADGDGNYTVAWSSVSNATSYTLQEAANSSFTGAVTAYSGSNTSTNISGKSPGTYYYRVRASNAGGDSAWSNTQSVTVTDSAEGDAYEPDDTCTQARAILTDSAIQERTFHRHADEDWAVFEATAGVTYRVEGQVPVGSPTDVNVEVYAQCIGDPLDEQHNTFAPGVRLEFTAPADGPLYLRWFNHDPAVYGDAVAYHISVQALAAEATPGAVIIVAGRDKHNDTLQPNIHYAAGQFYQMFQNNGYPASRIYYLSTDLTQPGANALATASNLEAALTAWTLDKVAADRPLTLYLIDHGMPNRLYLDKPAGEWVTPAQLNTWLAQVEAAHPGLKVNVFVEACYAGSFISLPQSLSRAGRVVATSTGATNLAYASSRGAVFSDYFSAALNQGMSVYSAFERARGATRAAYPYQTPWLDANGNGIPNEPADAQIAALRGFAYAGTLSSDQWPPYIVQVAPVTVSGGKGDLRVEARDDGEVRYVWAVIYPPSYTPPATQEELVQETLPTVMLLHQSAGWYGAQYTGFAEFGEYRVVFYAEDDLGLAAQPVAVMVRTGWGVYLPLVVRQ